MASWRVARSLDVLLAQLNALAPGRSKRSDGSIGDTSHQNRSSDHNPWYGPGIVTARDFTHDPLFLNCHSVAARLCDVENPDSRIKYVIWNGRIWTPARGGWRPYTGPNPHTSHLHLSVVASPACDDVRPWQGFIKGEAPKPAPEPIPEEKLMSMGDPLFLKHRTHANVYWWDGDATLWFVETEQDFNDRRAICQANGQANLGINEVDNLAAYGALHPTQAAQGKPDPIGYVDPNGA